MSTKFHSSIIHPVGRLLAAGLVAATLCVRLQAQYVSTAISNNLSGPYGVAQDPADNVYVTDSGNDRILEYTPSTTNVSTLAGLSGVAGTNNGANASARFDGPVGIVYARGGLVVVDQNNQELRYVSLAGVVTNLAGVAGSPGLNDGAALGAEFSYPTGIAVDGGGNLYIADQGNNKIRKLDTNNMVTTIGADHSFYLPYAVAVDNNGNIWVTDTGNQQICMISNGVTYVEAGTHRVIGTNDTSLVNHTGPLFDLPKGLYWDSSSNILVISDTGNDTIRKLYWTNYQGVAINVVQTLAGLPGMPGFIDGSLSTAQFNQPYGIWADTIDSGYYVVDNGNNALRVLQPIQPPPPPVPVGSPVVGYLTYPLNSQGIPSAQFNAFPTNGPIEVFNNPVAIAIEQTDAFVSTYYTQGATGSVPVPTASSPSPALFNSPNDYSGFPEVEVPTSVTAQFSPLPDLTIDVFSAAGGRPSSATVSTRVQFVMGNPTILGNNAAAVTLDDITTNAQMYYTLDGTPPVIGATDTFGPVGTNFTISFTITSNTTLSVQAFPPPSMNFAPSGIVSALFSPTNFSADQITFGFESGEGSSEFITAPGQTFIAPVTLSLISSGETIDSLQFSLAITNVTAPPVPLDSVNFSSMLEKPIPGSTPVAYEVIPSQMFVATNGTFTNLLFTNSFSNIDLLGVGWLERLGATNLYDTLTQTLITYSQAHDTLFMNSGGRVIAGAFSFNVPTSATLGQQYEIQIGSPSATSDGISTPVFIQAVTNGSRTNGTINATKIVTVGAAKYLVGDVAPFYWFNAGDFGDNTLQANDVSETFQCALYKVNGPTPATTNSDYFDAMDSSDGTDNNFYNGTDTDINSLTLGDHSLNVDDVYVTFRRSLDPSLVWVQRSDTAAGKVATIIPSGLSQPFGAIAPASAPAATTNSSPSGPRYITVGADQVQSGGTLTVQVPVRVLAADTKPITVLMLRLEVDPLDGSPPLTSPVTFSAANGLGNEYDSASQSENDYSGVWLNSTDAGISGAGLLGTLTVTLPSNVTSNSAYLVHFDHFSSSPNGLALFHATIQDGLITTRDRSGSSWGDGIPDSWRLLWFSSVSNSLSAANADPDGDGASNWQEYVAGTNPNDAASVFTFGPGSTFSPSSFTLQWPSVVNKHYSVQMSSSISPAKWTTLVTNLVGTGQAMQWQDNNATGKGQFYRAQVQ